MIQYMVQNDMGPKSKIEISDELCSVDRLVPYVSRIYDNLYSVLESNRTEELKITEQYFKDENYAYLI